MKSMTTIIDGKAFAQRVVAKVAEHTARLKGEHDITPGLAVILAGDDPASRIYVRNKGERTREAGMLSFEFKLNADTSEAELLAHISRLNDDLQVHGILCQLPLPPQINSHKIINAIAPEKDVDGFHTENTGRLWSGQRSHVPCTPLGCLMLLRDYCRPPGGGGAGGAGGTSILSGLHAVVIGRSNIVGKPMAALLLRDNCTVSVAHSRTKDIAALCRNADIVVAAVGRPEMIKGDWLKEGATVIDVGINRIPAPQDNKKSFRLVGDVEFETASKRAAAITPVPGGVGPMTIACLLANTITACCRIHGLAEPEEFMV